MAHVGRPSKYNNQILLKTREYIDNYKEIKEAVPTIAGLANYLKTSKDILYDWSKQKDKEQFSYLLNELLQKQEQLLCTYGLISKFNPTITKLMLSKHGYHDRPENISEDEKEIIVIIE